MRGNCSGVEVHLLSLLPKTGVPLPQTWYIFFLYSLEIFLLSTNFFLAFVLLKLLISTSVWHHNLKIIFIYFLTIQIPAHLGRLTFIFHEFIHGLRDGDCNSLLVTATFFELFYIHVVSHIPVAFCSERLLALYFIEDYEKRRRQWISLLILGILSITAFLFCSINITAAMPMDIFGYYVLFLVSLATVMFFFMFNWNRRLSERVEACKHPTEYTLSKKFQLVENMRVLRMCRNLMIVVGVLLVTISFSLISLVLFGWTNLGVISLDIIKSGAPLAVMSFLLLSVEKWKEKVKEWLNIRKTKTSIIQPQLKDSETDLYFKDLARSWNP